MVTLVCLPTDWTVSAMHVPNLASSANAIQLVEHSC